MDYIIEAEKYEADYRSYDYIKAHLSFELKDIFISFRNSDEKDVVLIDELYLKYSIFKIGLLKTELTGYKPSILISKLDINHNYCSYNNGSVLGLACTFSPFSLIAGGRSNEKMSVLLKYLITFNKIKITPYLFLISRDQNRLSLKSFRTGSYFIFDDFQLCYSYQKYAFPNLLEEQVVWSQIHFGKTVNMIADFCYITTNPFYYKNLYSSIKIGYFCTDNISIFIGASNYKRTTQISCNFFQITIGFDYHLNDNCISFVSGYENFERFRGQCEGSLISNVAF